MTVVGAAVSKTASRSRVSRSVAGRKLLSARRTRRIPAFGNGPRFRAGIERRISVLFRGRGIRRCLAEVHRRFALRPAGEYFCDGPQRNLVWVLRVAISERLSCRNSRPILPGAIRTTGLCTSPRQLQFIACELKPAHSFPTWRIYPNPITFGISSSEHLGTPPFPIRVGGRNHLLCSWTLRLCYCGQPGNPFR
jgi:hypothetical protein